MRSVKLVVRIMTNVSVVALAMGGLTAMTGCASAAKPATSPELVSVNVPELRADMIPGDGYEMQMSERVTKAQPTEAASLVDRAPDKVRKPTSLMKQTRIVE